MSMTQDNEVGDGTTSVTVLAAELLKEVRIFPQTYKRTPRFFSILLRNKFLLKVVKFNRKYSVILLLQFSFDFLFRKFRPSVLSTNASTHRPSSAAIARRSPSRRKRSGTRLLSRGNIFFRIIAARNEILSSKLREDLMKIACTTLGSKILSQHKEHFAKLAVDAVLRLKVGNFLLVSQKNRHSKKYFSRDGERMHTLFL